MRGVLSYIFGDISGGTPATAKFYTEKDINVYDVPGEMRLTDFDDLTNFGILDPRMTTIGGVAFRHLDRLPRVGDRVTFDDIQIEVLEMNEHRIARVRVAQGVDLDDLIDDSDVHVTEQEDLKDKTLDRPDAEEVEEGIDEELEIIGEEEADQFDENGDGFEAPRTGTEP